MVDMKHLSDNALSVVDRSRKIRFRMADAKKAVGKMETAEDALLYLVLKNSADPDEQQTLPGINEEHPISMAIDRLHFEVNEALKAIEHATESR